MRKLVGIFAIALAALAAAATPAQAEILVNETFPISFSVFNSCALGGVGENVLVTGDQHVVMKVTENENNRSVTVLFRTKASGTGLVSGDTYQLMETGLPDPYKVTLENGQAIGEGEFQTVFAGVIVGGGNVARFHFVNHMTVNPNGTIVVAFTHHDVECL